VVMAMRARLRRKHQEMVTKRGEQKVRTIEEVATTRKLPHTTMEYEIARSREIVASLVASGHAPFASDQEEALKISAWRDRAQYRWLCPETRVESKLVCPTDCSVEDDRKRHSGKHEEMRSDFGYYMVRLERENIWASLIIASTPIADCPAYDVSQNLDVPRIPSEIERAHIAAMNLRHSTYCIRRFILYLLLVRCFP
jgi:hypothetical protein